MSDQIESRNELFRGQLIDKQKRAAFTYDAQGVLIHKCPNCGHIASADDCDVLGAEPGCLFCVKCHREFET